MKEVIEYRGFNINIIPDEDYQSPDDWGNDDAFLVYDHRQFEVRRKGFAPREIYESRKESKKKLYDGYWVFPVDAYIHSGVVLSLANESDFPDRRWDVSTTGFALVKKIKGWTWREEKAREVARGIVNEWNDCLSGNVYGYTIDGLDDSCWGFYGDPDDYMISEAKLVIDSHIKSQRESHYQRLKTWIKNRVPLLHRQPLDEQLTF